jgi:uncharacterized protein YbjT (DUF2867 family)
VARSTGVDLTTGEGLGAALSGEEAVIDVGNITTTRRKMAVEFFTAASPNLVAADGRAGVSHLVSLSIVGIDNVDLGYYEGKRHQKQIQLAGTVPPWEGGDCYCRCLTSA